MASTEAYMTLSKRYTLREDLDRLLAKLGLNPSASFQDVVCAVRGQGGRLGRLETAILFLDEWKKQYTPKRPEK